MAAVSSVEGSSVSTELCKRYVMEKLDKFKEENDVEKLKNSIDELYTYIQNNRCDNSLVKIIRKAHAKRYSNIVPRDPTGGRRKAKRTRRKVARSKKSRTRYRKN